MVLSPKYFRLVMYPMELGIVPVKLLVVNFSDCRAVRYPTEVDSDLIKMLSLRSRPVNAAR